VQNNPIKSRQDVLLIKLASYASVLVALALVSIKLWAWDATGSISLLSSLADSVLDVLASILTFWAVRYSLSPPDEEHRFGHGKSEGLAALVQAMIIGGSGLYVCKEAIDRMLSPAAIASPEIGISVMFVATAATLFLVGFQRYVGKRTGSVAISADAIHYQADLLVNVGVGFAIIASSWSGWKLIDPIVGLVVVVFIMRSALGIAHRALEILLDHEIPQQDRQIIHDIALHHPEVQGIHDMRTRFGGNHYIVQFHVELEPTISLLRCHEILDEVEDEILHQYQGCEILIHADPIGLMERRDSFESGHSA
jgi:ferrous-iron efflux pump FieF